jgi:acyl carrier protein
VIGTPPGSAITCSNWRCAANSDPSAVRWAQSTAVTVTLPQAAAVELTGILRYTGRSRPEEPETIGLVCSRRTGPAPIHAVTKECLMSTTFDKVAEIIAETCDIPRENIKPESHAINDLEIDSLDFLDIAFAIDKAFGIKLPLEQWTQEVNDGKATTDQYFVLQNLSDRIDELIAAKGA